MRTPGQRLLDAMPRVIAAAPGDERAQAAETVARELLEAPVSHEGKPWWQREPVRLRMYAFLVLLAGYLCTRGVITGNDVAFYTAAGSILLGVPLVEAARNRVTPTP